MVRSIAARLMVFNWAGGQLSCTFLMLQHISRQLSYKLVNLKCAFFPHVTAFKMYILYFEKFNCV